MKKSTVKAAKSAAPVTPAKKAPVKIVKKAAVAPKGTATVAAAKPAGAPAVKGGTRSKAAATVISAQIDVGFGNALYIRGEGPGLSWDSGVLLDCVSGNLWSITLTGVTKPVVYKLLVNDLNWSVGEDYVAASGTTVVVVPAF